MFKYLKIDENSRIPKYKQIVDSVINNISNGNLKIDEKIPSINSFSEEFLLSRDTVEKAYQILKERKIITSIRGKGYYITRTKLIAKVNILFLINKLSAYKMRIYNSFINTIGGNSHTDLHIYHCDNTLFVNLIEKNINAYDYYVIMPHFKTDDLKHISYTDEAIKAINMIPKNKLVLMDNNNLEINGDFIEIYQDFENDIYNALKEGLTKISRYGKMILVYPENAVYPYPRRILHGFRKFCAEHKIDFEIIDEIYDDIILKKGDLFITIEETDLVNLVNQIRDKEFILGVEIGVISYNDTPLKELLGITVISTDFKAMGETASRMILNKEKGKIKNPFNFIDRNSI
ncbi:mannosyl-D-glycerate transport/metabolism system repressor MngR [Arenibacter sp. NBRC 103722]|jgi:DNA-binding transcriptional regulator YhcF (GntR family)|uniref:GntR family transcriptional regulator n=1 Tax=Arenibacter sp. NBRC 103722 TaxID=1113929 RepID=UPI00085355E2|nr:GntR family transcriptional regulator [Arenibacter sp. NBRC 103722]GBF20164.1 mannosyl-D-glycerate transport/metabolism system repressor MngR [Arenibacter sp. NBRC 103722]|tara:strand:+ start:936 stop:1976 length:1041 start_codon:yes stop_codon:yes gene_type:complete